MLTREQLIQCVSNKLDLQEKLRGKAFGDRAEREVMLIEEMAVQNIRAGNYNLVGQIASVA